MVKKLGPARCVCVRPPPSLPLGSFFPKDANEAVLRAVDVNQLLGAALPLPHKQLTSFSELRQLVMNEIVAPHQTRGTQSLTLPSLSAINKGHRSGEMTILTGPTGSGKTTLLSQLSLDYCQQGVATLWGSFEITAPRLLRTMLNQHANKYVPGVVFNLLLSSYLCLWPKEFVPAPLSRSCPHCCGVAAVALLWWRRCGRNLVDHIEEFDEVADDFSTLPLHLLRFFGRCRALPLHSFSLSISFHPCCRPLLCSR